MSNNTVVESGSLKPWIALVIALLGLALAFVYQAAYPGDFVHDDVEAIRSNPGMGKLSSWLEVATQGAGLSARPLTQLSFSINQMILGEEAKGFLIVNLSIHLLSSILLMRLLWLLTADKDEASPNNIRIVPIGALVILWAVHPMNVSAVAYIYQRMESLMACCFLAASIQIVHFLKQPGWLRLVLATFFALLSALANESAVVLPFVPFVLSVAMPQPTRVRRSLSIALPLLLTWPVVLWYLVPQSSLYRSTELSEKVSSWTYLLTETQVIGHYVKSFVWPERLSLVYDWPAVNDLSEVAVAIFGLMIAFVLGIYSIYRSWLIGTGIFWFLLCLLPTSSVLPFSWFAADYRPYLAFVGLMVVILGVVQMAGSALKKYASVWNISIAILLLVWATPLTNMGRGRASRFQSRLAIWTDALESGRAPHSAPAVLGSYYLEQKDLEKAEAFARQAIEALPSRPKPWSVLVTALNQQDKNSEAEETLDRAFEAAIDDGSLAFARGNMLKAQDVTGAIKCFEQAVELDPRNAGAWNNLGLLLARDEANYGRSRECYEKSLSIQLKNRSAYQNLAALHVKAGKLYDAREVLTKAQDAFPRDSDLRSRLATVSKLIRETEQQSRGKK